MKHIIIGALIVFIASAFMFLGASIDNEVMMNISGVAVLGGICIIYAPFEEED